MEGPWNSPIPAIIFGGLAAAIMAVIFIHAVAEARRRQMSPLIPAGIAVWIVVWGLLLLSDAANNRAFDGWLASYPLRTRTAIVSSLNGAAHGLFSVCSCLLTTFALFAIAASFAIFRRPPGNRLLRVAFPDRRYWRLVDHRDSLALGVRIRLFVGHVLTGLCILSWGALGISWMLGVRPSGWHVLLFLVVVNPVAVIGGLIARDEKASKRLDQVLTRG